MTESLAVAVTAVTFELLPERIDLLSAMLQFAGAGGLFGVGIGRLQVLRGADGRDYAEIGTLGGAAIGLGFFVFGCLLVQGLS